MREFTHALEIRPGEGGEDAAAFAAQFTRALTARIARSGLPTRIVTTDGRTHQVLLDDRGANALRHFAGTHRVQRILTSDRHGRRHTSTATVAIVDTTTAPVELDDDDLEVQFTRGTGPGGQHRNKVATAARLRHRPTGIVVTRTSGRSQSANLPEARADLQARLVARASGSAARCRNAARRAQVAGGDRPAKTFTAFGPHLAALPPCGECGDLTTGCLGGGACSRADLASRAAWAPFHVDLDADEDEEPEVVERRARRHATSSMGSCRMSCGCWFQGVVEGL
ncbi:MAG TPA: peptide chain release factor-like protein [Actinomycetes bacterium]|nr:peptide chain release factor-like protein [Actinomycetes bacterium]